MSEEERAAREGGLGGGVLLVPERVVAALGRQDRAPRRVAPRAGGGATLDSHHHRALPGRGAGRK